MTAHWLWFDGVEIANPARTRAYVNLAVPDVDTPLYCASCAPWGTVEQYANVALDPAPWFDDNTQASREFFGLFVTRTGGLDDSTRAGRVIQLLGDGGAITGLRHEPREMRVSGILIGLTKAGVEAGSSWLSSVLERGRESNLCAGGSTLEWMNDCSSSFLTGDGGFRQSRSVRCMAGPSIIGEHEAALHYQRVEFTLVSPSPRVFHRPVQQAAWVEGVQEARRAGVTITDPVVGIAECVYAGGEPYTVMDPGSTLPPLPPTAPSTPSHPAEDAVYNDMRVVFLPGGMSPTWTVAALTITIHATVNTSDIRVRVIEQVDPTETLHTANVCNLGGEYFISYIPAGFSVTVDGAEQSISGALFSGAEAIVSHLVSSSRPDQVMQFPVVKSGRAAWVVVESGSPVGVEVEASAVLR